MVFGSSKKKPKKEVDIASISFAYDNEELLSLLGKRGNLIANGKLDKLEKLE